VHRDQGHDLLPPFAGREHFGFKDGVSSPAVRGRVSDDPDDFLERRDGTLPPDDLFPEAERGKVLVWPGHYLFGYQRQKLDEPAVADPNPLTQPRGPDWAKNGSYLVFRRLSQDVEGFRSFLVAGAARLNAEGWTPPITDSRLAALLVGRWPSGTPVMLSPDGDPGPDDGANDFGYASERTVNTAHGAVLQPEDIEGRVCPRGAHVRKVNPRDLVSDLGPKTRTLPRLLLRRGIPFERSRDEDGSGSTEKGLLFLAFQSSIRNQFEFLMTDWVGGEDKPEGEAGIDPILANGADRFVILRQGDREFRLPVPGGWVIPTGGEYFFLPGLAFFQGLAAHA
jgi:Dyp-type peroxidase family